jgi:hypothetical protein
MKKGIITVSVMSAIILVFSSIPAFAVEHRDLSDSEIGAISQNCASIKIHLQRVQKDDAKNRVNLGSQYETIATNLMLNLNLRLVKNGIANAYLAEQQTTFASERTRFKDDFIGYSQEFENLLNINCKEEPIKFYRQLELVREKRADIKASMDRLNGILVVHRQSILELKESL